MRKFKTQDNTWQMIVRFILMIIWEPISKKKSYWWDWVNYSKYILLQKFVLGNPNAKKRDTFWSNIYQTNFGWKEYVVVSVPEKFQDKVKTYQVGFLSKIEGVKLCSLIFEKNQQVAMLVGPEDFKVFAIGDNGRYIRLKISKKKNKKYLDNRIVLI